MPGGWGGGVEWSSTWGANCPFDLPDSIHGVEAEAVTVIQTSQQTPYVCPEVRDLTNIRLSRWRMTECTSGGYLAENRGKGVVSSLGMLYLLVVVSCNVQLVLFQAKVYHKFVLCALDYCIGGLVRLVGAGVGWGGCCGVFSVYVSCRGCSGFCVVTPMKISIRVTFDDGEQTCASLPMQPREAVSSLHGSGTPKIVLGAASGWRMKTCMFLRESAADVGLSQYSTGRASMVAEAPGNRFLFFLAEKHSHNETFHTRTSCLCAVCFSQDDPGDRLSRS